MFILMAIAVAILIIRPLKVTFVLFNNVGLHRVNMICILHDLNTFLLIELVIIISTTIVMIFKLL